VEPKPREPKLVKAIPIETKVVAVQDKPKVVKMVEPSAVVGRIREHVITRAELENEVMQMIRSNPDEYVKKDGSADVKAVLLKMIAEKAFMVDGREQGILEDPFIKTDLKLFRERMLANLLLQRELRPKLKVSEAEIDQRIKTDPKLNRATARNVIEREKARKLTDQFYQQLYKKLNVQKLTGNFGRAANIYARLLFAPQERQRMRFVKKSQVEEDLTLEEKNIVLATFEGGQATLKEWFDLFVIPSPPRRPRDAHTAEGVGKFLDNLLRLELFVAEATLRGLDRDEGYLKQVRDEEEKRLFTGARRAKLDEVKRPTDEEVKPYFDRNKEKFKTPDTIDVDQIWCEDLRTALKVREELSGGKDFESVKQQYSLAKEDKPLSINARGEAMFFEQLWKAEPNEIVGPLKGFYLDRRTPSAKLQVRWRIVKILQKKPGQEKEYAASMEREVKSWISYERREEALAKYRKELLKKYSYKIYPEDFEDFDPLDIP